MLELDGAERLCRDDHRLIAQGAAGEQPANESLPRLRRVSPPSSWRRPGGTSGSRDPLRRRRDVGLTHPEVADDDGLAQRLGVRCHLAGHVRGWRLGDHDDGLHVVISRKPVKSSDCGATAYFGRQVPPSHSDAVLHTETDAIEQREQLLGSRARCGDDSDGTWSYDVGEPQSDPVDDSGPAVGAHHQQP